MRFLLDNNLSYKLKKCFVSAGHECEHVSNLAMQKANDMDIWSFARSNNYIIVTQDNDFTDILNFNGYPPKVLLLKIGNCRTNEIADLLNRNMSAIQDVFEEDVGIIELEQN